MQDIFFQDTAMRRICGRCYARACVEVLGTSGPGAAVLSIKFNDGFSASSLYNRASSRRLYWNITRNRRNGNDNAS